MKLLLDMYAKRLNARTRRERMLIFFAGVAVLLGISVRAWDCALARAAQDHGAACRDQSNQIVVGEAQKTALEQQLRQDPDAVIRERIVTRRNEIAQIDAQLSGLQRSLVPPERMAAVLQDLVGQDRRVRIVRLQNVAATPLVREGPPDPAVPAKAGTNVAGRHVFKHAVQVTVEGNYLDLLGYVARLEKQPWQVYWGRTTMVADYPKVQIELTLYTLSLDRAWLVV
jgi:MSHA biogenesis protein MshJ